MEKTSVEEIFRVLKGYAESEIPVPREKWLDGAWSLIVLRVDKAKEYNLQRQKVAQNKLAILKGQDKKNVALAEAETEASPEYLEMKNLEDTLYSIDELIRVAKKSSDNIF